LWPGLPDGFISDQKYQFGYILEDLEMENVFIWSVHLEYFTTIGYIYSTFGNFVVIWCIFPALVYCTKKNLATLVCVYSWWWCVLFSTSNWPAVKMSKSKLLTQKCRHHLLTFANLT
jgi:hypothetical protein